MSNYIKITFKAITKEQIEILIALLQQIGYEAFEEGRDFLIACIPEEDFDATLLNESIPSSFPEPIHEVIAPQNWNQEWENSFKPVVLDNFCAIRASFHESVPSVPYEIIITPKMSFGTGHHATTWLMIDQMREIEFAGKSVLDFGTGTGVLAILSEKLGANSVLAIDCDEWSITNANENIAANHCTRIELQLADCLPATGAFDIILANINKNVLLRNMKSLKQQLSIGCVLLLSGLLRGDYEDLKAEALKNNLVIESSKEREGWLVIKLS